MSKKAIYSRRLTTEWSRGPHPQSPPRSRQQTDLLSKQQTELGLARQVKTKPGKQLGKG